MVETENEESQPKDLPGPVTDEVLDFLWRQYESGAIKSYRPQMVARLVSEIRRLRSMVQTTEEYFEALKERRPRAADHFASKFLVALAGLKAEEKERGGSE